MNLQLTKGTYVVAVSGGVDSMVLLDLCVKKYVKNSQFTFVVAHVDHGIRIDSSKDELLVRDAAKNYGLAYESIALHLGKDASEEKARTERYAFLRSIASRYGAKAILTAHHQDDLLETIIMHVLRGTTRRGLTPMNGFSDILRPLLDVEKKEIVQYAQKHQLLWHEDSTNNSNTYTRNRIRKQLAKAKLQDKKALLAIHVKMAAINKEADELVKHIAEWTCKNGAIQRARFVLLDYAVASEVVAYLLGGKKIYYDKHVISRSVEACKTARLGTKADITDSFYLHSKKASIQILQK